MNRIIVLLATIFIFSSLYTRANAETYWPHAISCGGDEWDAMFILHGNPIGDSTNLAYYVQVYPNEYRYVRFNADGSYYDRAGSDASSVGCENKSTTQLQEENRTFSFIGNVSKKSWPDYWPHAISCASDEWDAMFILHGNPIGDSTDLAYYVQVYPNEYRYVRFNADGSYYDRAGSDASSVGCESKSMSQLQEEDRMFYFADEVPINKPSGVGPSD
uniref:Uncharacterized protein n=1 Tax=Candidatus Kentrum sp. FM TaxID=2126340 RepID=A0A450TYA9_9GAMM|nr:MAG: hypothetical protein BECKFM1743C_GA0114222_107951 [Candidatus Kentron sp. FM]VFJ74918.1 MAG: hypothetical protein BECKFM1743A_GA0114220_108041 [Candidatus Kentron sp. FM]VFK21660.1 MAG: hypothetical protein BECKFM1743B_GA0114221_108042 [Candidatus Kentron sp. FM]